MEQLRPEDQERVTKGEGQPPIEIPTPAPGVYWIKMTTRGFYWIDRDGNRLENPTHLQIWSVPSWNLAKETNWFLVAVDENGFINALGSDEICQWSRPNYVVTKISYRVMPPSEE